MDGKKIAKVLLVAGGLATSSVFSYALGALFHDALTDERIYTLKPEKLGGKLVWLWSEVCRENHEKLVQDILKELVK